MSVEPRDDDSGWLDRPWVPALSAGLATAILSWWVWGMGPDPVAVVHDESAYRLQAGIFAGGRWADHAPPLEGFFDQVHVLSSPVRAAKYAPGHALTLAPGFRVGAPHAVPLLLDFATGALVFALARRASGGAVGLLTWLLWLMAPGGLHYRSSYLSELTTGAAWLVGWWALWSWRNTAKWRWIALFGLCIGWGAVTRPLTTLAFALPAGLVSLALAARLRAWRQFAAAALAGSALLLIWPLWSARTTGDVRLSPLALYTRDVIPWDRMGFGLDSTAARHETPAVSADFVNEFRALHARHTVANLPAILGERLSVILRDLWGGLWAPFVALALLGALRAPGPARIALASAALLVLFYLSYAHVPEWSAYYFEAYGVMAYCAGLGLWKAWQSLVRAARAPRLVEAGPWLPAAVLAFLAASNALAGRALFDRRASDYRRFQAALGDLPARSSVVFVRSGPAREPHKSLVANGPDIASSRTWVVHDRGPANDRLLGLAPEREAYLYDAATGKMIPLPRRAPPADRYNPRS